MDEKSVNWEISELQKTNIPILLSQHLAVTNLSSQIFLFRKSENLREKNYVNKNNPNTA